VKQPDKKKCLSGDPSAFLSAGKAKSRSGWKSHCQYLHRSLSTLGIKGKLNYLWLANNEFSDIEPLFGTARTFIVPDNNAMNRAAKRRTLVNKYTIPKKNSFIRIVHDIAHAQSEVFFDVVNLDTCNHLDKDTLVKIEELLKYQTEEHCYFFATFARTSMKMMMSKQFPEFKRLSGTKDGINDILVNTFRKHNYKVKTLDGFPFTYETEHTKKNGNQMHSFGWELKRI
jgi:hypothetical protein